MTDNETKKIIDDLILPEFRNGKFSEVHKYKPRGEGRWTAGKPILFELSGAALQNHCSVRLLFHMKSMFGI